MVFESVNMASTPSPLSSNTTDNSTSWYNNSSLSTQSVGDGNSGYTTTLSIEETSMYYELDTEIYNSTSTDNNTTDFNEIITSANRTLSGILTNLSTTTNSSLSIFVSATTSSAATPTRSLTPLSSEATTLEWYWDTGSNVTAAVFLTVFILASITGNVTIIASLRHKHFKNVAMYAFLSNLCVVMMCDTIVNMALVLGATVTGRWPYGDFMCQLSAFMLNMINVETVLALFVLVLDRLLATRWQVMYINNMNRAKANILAGITWLYATTFALSVLIGPESIYSGYFPHSYLCNVTSNTGITFLVILSFFCYICPILAILVMFVIIIKVGVEDKANVQALNNRTLYGFELSASRSPLWDELRRSKAVAALFILWCVFQGPYLTLHSVYTFKNSDYPVIMMNFYPRLMEIIFAWMRFSYAYVAPLVIFSFWPEAREEPKSLFCQKSNNTATSGGGRAFGVAHDILQKPGVRASWASSADESSVPSTLGRAFQVPILLATANGLRLQVGRNQKDTDIDENGEVIKQNRERRYITEDSVAPFAAVESVEEGSAAVPPVFHEQRRSSPSASYDNYGQQGHHQPNIADDSSTFQLSLNSGTLSPRRTSPRSLPPSPRGSAEQTPGASDINI